MRQFAVSKFDKLVVCDKARDFIRYVSSKWLLAVYFHTQRNAIAVEISRQTNDFLSENRRREPERLSSPHGTTEMNQGRAFVASCSRPASADGRTHVRCMPWTGDIRTTHPAADLAMVEFFHHRPYMHDPF